MPIRLDERLARIASLVDYGKVADVGCDHGKLGYYLIGTDRASKVIATDISAPSLQKASELARENGVSELMQTRLGDGLVPVESGEVDTVIIAGLGGDVISGILEQARADGKSFEYFILSPNTHAEKVRQTIICMGHTILFDDLLTCAGKTYTVIKTKKGEERLDENQIKYGKFYLTNKTFKRQLENEITKKRAILERTFSEELKKKVVELEHLLSTLTCATE